MKNIYARLLSELENNQPLALATIIKTRGSTPQIPGASALFTPDGLLTGTLGGGGMEGDAEQRSRQCLRDGASSLYDFELNSDITAAEGAICGGAATILIDARPDEHAAPFERLRQSLKKNQAGVLATAISRQVSGASCSLSRHWFEGNGITTVNMEAPWDRYREELSGSLKDGAPRLVDHARLDDVEDAILYLEPVYPLPHLVVAGAGHIGQALTHLGALLDFEVTVIDDRPEFANREKLPDADHIIAGDIGQAMHDTPLSADTYVVIVTRGHQDDTAALKQCIESEAAYVGMIGSARKIELTRKRFVDEGWATPAQFDKVYAPIGIGINSKTVPEIAVSIAAQLIDIRYRKRHN